MRYEAPKNLFGKELFRHLIANKSSIIKSKKSTPIKSAPIGVGAGYAQEEKGLEISKAYVNKANEIAYGEPFQKSVIGNLCGWRDSYQDVSLRGSFNRTVNNNAKSMHFLRDHQNKTSAIIAKLIGVEVREISLASLGIDTPMISQEGIVFTGEFDLNLDKQAYYAYYNKLAQQHSISLQYVGIDLAVNDPEFADEYKVWQETYKQVINIEEAEEEGYYWAISEQKVFENSWVLNGANIMTPALDEEDKSTPINEPATIGTSENKDSENRRSFLSNYLQVSHEHYSNSSS